MSRYETFHKPRVDLHKYSIWNYAILSLSKLANHEHLKQLKNSRVILQDITVMSAKTHGSFTFKTWFSLGGGPSAPFDLKMVGEKIQNISVFRAFQCPIQMVKRHLTGWLWMMVRAGAPFLKLRPRQTAGWSPAVEMKKPYQSKAGNHQCDTMKTHGIMVPNSHHPHADPSLTINNSSLWRILTYLNHQKDP